MAVLMKAVRYHGYGGPEVLIYEDAPRPEPEADEVLIRVHAASVNPADWQIRSGKRFLLEKPFSLTPGFDVSGVVEATGDRVTDFVPGNEVYGMLGLKNSGAYAEYVTCPAAGAAHKPRSLTHIEAAALPVAGLTAWQALFDAGGLSEGQTVLIHAAAGGVGHLAVQLAKWKGARIIGTASARNSDFLREIGCDEIIDYTKTRFEDVVRNVDVVLDSVIRDAKKGIDAVAQDTLLRSFTVLQKNGILVSICDTPSQEMAAARGVRAVHILAESSGMQLAQIAELTDAGNLRPLISEVFPLKEARKTHELSQGGHTRGKIVLQVIA
jgi:NADPH:quinone reductase-like Zn-dependent oxidoreductase